MNMALPLMPAPALAQEMLPLRPQENTALPPLMNMALPLMPAPAQAQEMLPLRLQESTAPLLTTLMVLPLRPLALALARSPLTPMLPLLLMRTLPGGAVARARESELRGVAKLSAEVAPRRTSLPRRARAAARPPGRAASSRGSQSSSRGGQPRQARGSSRGVDVDSSPSQSLTGAHTGTPLPSVTLDVASRLRLIQSPSLTLKCCPFKLFSPPLAFSSHNH